MNQRQPVVTMLMVIAACTLIVQASVSSQSQSPPPQAAAGDALKHGEAWFYQRCSLCHMGRIVKDDVYKPMAPSLSGLFKDASPDREKLIRDIIQRGSLRMPGFRYNFTPTEFEELVAYLKTL